MAVPPRRLRASGTYFITSRTWESRKLFLKAPICEIVIDTRIHYRDNQNYLLHSFVLMPDHVHLILTPGPKITLERAVQFIKGGSARRILQTFNYRFPVWQRGFTDHRIRDSQDYHNHLQYIESNPVKAGLAVPATEYLWCSAGTRFPTDGFPQALKPLANKETFGTVETVPLQDPK